MPDLALLRRNTAAGPIAPELAGLLRQVCRGELPLRVRAWDGSTAGPADGPTVILDSPMALRRLLWHPGELGLAQAYVSGDVDIDGDLREAFERVWEMARDRDLAVSQIGPRTVLKGIRLAARLGVIGPPPEAPRSQAQLRGRRHTLGRDRQAISHHYDLSNAFYEAILDPHMAYSCAYWRDDQQAATLEQAQAAKLELVCRKLGLRPGMRLLDVGCGWGSLSLYAAEHCGVDVVGITLSREQRDFVVRRARRRGLSDHVDIRLQDYREIVDGPFDAIASIEMGEHVGRDNYSAFIAQLHRLVRPRGRVLIQQMSHGPDNPDGGPFIGAFIAPDMHMRPVGETVALIEKGGLEVRDVHAMREHYVRTVEEWLVRFEAASTKLERMVGIEVMRVWRLYLTGGLLTFRDGRMGVDQILAVRPTRRGESGVSRARPDPAWR